MIGASDKDRKHCSCVGEIKSDNFVPINLSMCRLRRRHLRANPHAARLFGSNAINLSTAELHCVRQMNLSPAPDAARIQGSAQVGAGDRPASMAGQRPDVYRTVEPNGLRQLAQRNGASSKRAVSRYGVQCPQDEQPLRAKRLCRNKRGESRKGRRRNRSASGKAVEAVGIGHD